MGLFSSKKKAPFTGAFFDLNGTLFDTERWFERAWWAVLARRGLSHREYDPEWHAGRKGLEYVQPVMAHFGIDEPPEAFLAEWCREARTLAREHAEPCKGVRRILKDLAKLKVRMAVVTSSSTEMTQELLKKHGLTKRFEFVTTGDVLDFHGLRGKPYPDAYFSAAHFMGVPTGHCVAFEDSFNGVVSAKTAGCRTVIGVVNYPEEKASKVGAKREALKRAGADLTFATLDDCRISGWIDSL